MYARVEKTKEKRSSALTNSVVQKEGTRKQGAESVDNRFKSITPKKPLALIDNHSSIQTVLKQERLKPTMQLQEKGNDLTGLRSFGVDISYSIAPHRSKESGRFSPDGPDVLQRLIVVDDDMDASRLMAAVRIYYKHKDTEQITTIHKAKNVKLAEGEKLYLVAHGTGDKHGDRSAKELATILKTWGLHPNSSVIKLISCFSGKDAPYWSYANQLALELNFMYKVVGINGLESTDKQGHTRATEQLVDDATFNKAYFGVLNKDDSFQNAEKIASKVKADIERCKLGEEVPLMVRAYEEIDKLCQGVFQKLEVALKGMVRDKEKSESEDIMTPIGEI